MREGRRDPERILKAVEREESRKFRGHLYIFFGYAAGVGKTYAMLKEAHNAQNVGIDVVVGYVEPHMRPDTTALLEGLEVLPTKVCTEGNVMLHEFDLDGALARRPQLLLVDELAHTNAPGCRHAKRYQDVEELLAAGIDVYTTVNVQHIESLNDMVSSITGVIVRERIPDKMFDDADRVKIVDVEPEELLERLRGGKIYGQEQAKTAASHFFTLENLTALREIALRRCADRVNALSEAARAKSGNEYYTDEHILVCISPAPTNQKIIRNAARMAKAFHGKFTALFVETPDYSTLGDEDKKQLRDNIHLAEQLGAEVETVYGDDVALQISEYAKLSGVSKVVVGRSSARKKRFFRKPSMTDRLLGYAPNLDIYVIPDQEAVFYQEQKKQTAEKTEILVSDVLKSIGLLAAATVIGFIFYNVGFSESNIIIVYILGVLITAVVTTRRLYSLISSILSVIVFNFCFTEPRFTFRTYDPGYPATFVIMFLAAFIMSWLATRLKNYAKQSAATAFRTKILLDTNDMLTMAVTKKEITETMASQLIKLLHRDILYYPWKKDGLAEPICFPAKEGEEVPAECTSEKEKAIAAWVYKNNKHAGATTDTLGDSRCLYLAVRAGDKVYGVVAIAMEKDKPLDSFENNIMLSIIGEGALAFENEQAIVERERGKTQQKNEKLSAHLLRAISNDLRAPLNSVADNAGLLVSQGESMTPEERESLYSDICDDSMWLVNLIENVLSVTQIEDGTMQMNQTEVKLGDIIDEAMKHTIRQSREHHLFVRHSEEILLVRVDEHLIMQVIINIVDNAIKYTSVGSYIEIRSMRRGKNAVVTISDNGPGIADNAKPHIFDMFYTGKKVEATKRSLGLGLPLSKYIIAAHGGTVDVSDNHPHGTVLTFTLPLEQKELPGQAAEEDRLQAQGGE